MIHYHGTPITPESACAEIMRGRHGLVSFAHPMQINLISDICQSFILDNGAFSFWKSHRNINWPSYYAWVDTWRGHPNFDWALIPDIIEGTEQTNDDLLAQWPFGTVGVPVWHMHESLTRLSRLALNWPRVAIGSSAEFSIVGNALWWKRMADAMKVACDATGQARTKLHGLRMLNPKIFSRLPFASADSTNVARNIGIDKKWKGTYTPHSKGARGIVLAGRIEATNSSAKWEGM